MTYATHNILGFVKEVVGMDENCIYGDLVI
jgi:hypothetical protein